MGTFVGASSAGANIDVLTGVSWPAGVVSGDIALLPWTFQNIMTPTDPTSDSFSLVADNQDGSARLRCLYRYCNATESGAITGWENRSGGVLTANRQTAVLYVARGYQFISGFTVRLEGATALSTHATPQISTTDGFNGNFPANGDTIVTITSTRDGATVTVTPPGGYQIRTNGQIGLAASGGTHTAVADDGLASAVSLPHTPGAFTGYGTTSANAVTMTIALRPATVTGTAAATQAAQTSTASGSVSSTAITGTAAISQAANTSTATAILGYTGTSARAQSAQTSTASGVLGYTGTSARTQAAQTSTAAGNLGYTGTATPVQAAGISAASGSVLNPVTGSAAPAQAAQSAFASGALGYVAIASPAQADATASASGIYFFPTIGTADVPQEAQTASAVGVSFDRITTRPDLGVAPRTAAGVTPRPFAGTTPRP